MSQTKFISLLPSTDVEFTRWLFSHYQVDYTEYPHAPVFHIVAQYFHGYRGNEFPLIIRDGEKIVGVDTLFSLLEAEAPEELKLLPKDKELAELIMRDQLDLRDGVGMDVVNWSYWNFMKYKSVIWPSLTTKVPWHEKLAYFLGFPVFRGLVFKGLKVDQTVAKDALKEIYKTWDYYDDVLSEGRSYLIGEKLTIFDLVFVSMLAPMILAQGYHGMLPNQVNCPEYMQKVFIELRKRPTGQFIQRIYDQHRPASAL